MKKNVTEEDLSLWSLLMALLLLAGAFWAFFMALKVVLEFVHSLF